MNVLLLIQARLNSSRLPGKVLADIGGRPMLAVLVERVQQSKLVDHVAVVTSLESSDDSIENWCFENAVSCFRGSLDDVLDRYYQAAKKWMPAHIVRITGDCPLIDPEIIDGVIKQHLDEQNDYTSNVIPPTFPDGLDVEIMTVEALFTAWVTSNKKSEREHVTLGINQNPDKFKIGNYACGVNLSDQRWTVDEAEDLEFVRLIMNYLPGSDSRFSFLAVLEVLQAHPEIQHLNSMYKRNEGLIRSLLND